MNITKALPEVLEERLNNHLDKDYPEVLARLTNIEIILHEIRGGMTVIRWLGWLVTAIGGVIIFFQEQIIHLFGK